ncbi:hypothetical protein [uncultured Bacteroides sp.]|uniref:hypothetical protein n=1 Tax=uncultured Bacteroides sp. TaxID=162156 RepID=UPI0026280733|nr:hypothetical protein [uncultured Bacteroides sp.]
MEDNTYFELPELIELTQFGGDFNRYLEAVYELFKRDFIDRKPVFRGMRVGLKKYPLYQDKEATFWHMTTEGNGEANRKTDLRRMERIQWPAPMINNSTHSYLKVWENTRGTKTNVLIFHDAENYLVVLRKANGYIIPWTAYLIEHKARKYKLMKEYENYKKQGAI